MSQARGRVSNAEFFFVFFIHPSVCVRSPASTAYLCLVRPLSLALCNRQRATFLTHSASDTQTLGVEERGSGAEGGLLHC